MIFGRNYGCGFSGPAVADAVEDSIKSCLVSLSTHHTGDRESLEAIVVIKDVKSYKVLPVYGIESLWADETKAVYRQLKAGKVGLVVEIHTVVELSTIRGTIVVLESIVDDIVSYDEFLKRYSLETLQ